MPVVVDASATLAWCFEPEATVASDALWTRANEVGLLVPPHWPVEVASVLRVGELRRRITSEEADEFLWLLNMLVIEVDQDGASQAWHGVMRLARDAGLTAYDAAYLELAMRTGQPLATRDASLIAAAVKHGVVLVPA